MRIDRRLDHRSSAKQCEGLALDLRNLSQQYVEIGRQLALMAERIERGDGLAPVALGEITEALIARILAGKLDDRG